MVKEEEKDKILSTLKENKDNGEKGMAADGLASHLDIPLSEMEYYLMKLSDQGYIEVVPSSLAEHSTTYQIMPLGTGWLMDKRDNE